MSTPAARGPGFQLFFSSDRSEQQRALVICRTCPVRSPWGGPAIQNNEQGVWGGTTVEEREANSEPLAG